MRRWMLAPFVTALLAAGCAGGSQYVSADTNEPVSTAGVRTVGDVGEAPSLVTVRLPDLDPPDTVRGDCQTFVAWVRTSDGALQRAGKIDYDRQMREGRISILTGLTDFQLLVTAEPNDDVLEPGPSIVVRRSIDG